jgi:hypothetical protein
MADVLLSACGPPETQTTALGTHSRSLLELAAVGCSRRGGWSTCPRCGRSGDYGGCSGGRDGPGPSGPAGRTTARSTRLVCPRLRGRARNDPQRGEAIPTALKAPARTTVAQPLSRRQAKDPHAGRLAAREGTKIAGASDESRCRRAARHRHRRDVLPQHVRRQLVA